MQIFGFEIKRKDSSEKMASVVTPSSDDGSTVVNSAAAYYGMVMDVEGVVKNENDLIRRYREIAQYADTDSAIDDIVNETLVSEEDCVELDLEKVKLSASIKDKIQEEFKEVLRLLKFSERGHDIFRSWYIDGRVYYHILLDENNIKQGIVELRYVDPRKIRRIKNIKKERTPKGVDVIKEIDEYYLYNDKGITEQTTQGVKLSIDSIVYAPSGMLDANTGMMLSHLHKAIKPVNQLKMIEDASVIYRISRAPERRVFYVDVGNLPKLKAEEYVNQIMNKFRNKVVYDATTGEVRDDRKHLSMMEDFWMPRREGGKGTEITTLQGGQNLGEIQDIQYFQQKLFQALNVPLSRLQPSTGFSLGRSTEITRDEIKFSKFVKRLRNRFSTLFLEALRVQLIVKGIIRADEWDNMREGFRFVYDNDNHFSELKDNEILLQRITMLQQLDPYVGRYYSSDWVRKNVLQQSEEDIKNMDKEMQEDLVNQMHKADFDGTVSGITQTAQQTYLKQFAPQDTEEASPPQSPQKTQKEKK
jgi:hypothetical protein